MVTSFRYDLNYNKTWVWLLSLSHARHVFVHRHSSLFNMMKIPIAYSLLVGWRMFIGSVSSKRKQTKKLSSKWCMHGCTTYSCIYVPIVAKCKDHRTSTVQLDWDATYCVLEDITSVSYFNKFNNCLYFVLLHYQAYRFNLKYVSTCTHFWYSKNCS